MDLLRAQVDGKPLSEDNIKNQFEYRDLGAGS
jgi:hypothetical protein